MVGQEISVGFPSTFNMSRIFAREQEIFSLTSLGLGKSGSK